MREEDTYCHLGVPTNFNKSRNPKKPSKKMWKKSTRAYSLLGRRSTPPRPSSTQDRLQRSGHTDKETREEMACLCRPAMRCSSSLLPKGEQEWCRLLHRILETLGFRPLMLHGDMARANRNKNLRKFKEESQSYMVATDVAGRGMDFREVSAVKNFDRPNVKEDYTRRVGRTAMAGNTGLAITLLPKSNKVDLGYMVKMLKNKILKEFKLGMSEEEVVQVYQERTDNAIRIGNAVVAELKKEQENEQMKRSLLQDHIAMHHRRVARRSTRPADLQKHHQDCSTVEKRAQKSAPSTRSKKTPGSDTAALEEPEHSTQPAAQEPISSETPTEPPVELDQQNPPYVAIEVVRTLASMAKDHGVCLLRHHVSVLAYADDLLIMAKDKESLQAPLDTTGDLAGKIGLHFKGPKCATLHLDCRKKRTTLPTTFCIQEHPRSSGHPDLSVHKPEHAIAYPLLTLHPRTANLSNERRGHVLSPWSTHQIQQAKEPRRSHQGNQGGCGKKSTTAYSLLGRRSTPPRPSSTQDSTWWQPRSANKASKTCGPAEAPNTTRIALRLKNGPKRAHHLRGARHLEATLRPWRSRNTRLSQRPISSETPTGLPQPPRSLAEDRRHQDLRLHKTRLHSSRFPDPQDFQGSGPADEETREEMAWPASAGQQR
ncbi:hypothetical protein LAZ67_1008336, partial [Cordylochernes scorpioides]